MATITGYFEQAQLSMAAYASLQRGMSDLSQTSTYIAALTAAGMSDVQATEFVKNYSVVDQIQDPTGFSATVFKDTSGVRYIAIRGTQTDSIASSALDWLTNVDDVGADGIAIKQGLALYNYLQRLHAPQGTIDQYSYNSETRTISKTAITLDTNGLLYGQNTPVSVTGHSLGGHLAMMMSRMAPNLVSEVFTYNAPGFDTPLWINFFPLTKLLPLTSGTFFNLLRDAATSPLTGPIGTGWNGGIMSHFNVPGDVVHRIGSTPGTTPQTIYSEEANEGPIDAHSVKGVGKGVRNLFRSRRPAPVRQPRHTLRQRYLGTTHRQTAWP